MEKLELVVLVLLTNSLSSWFHGSAGISSISFIN